MKNLNSTRSCQHGHVVMRARLTGLLLFVGIACTLFSSVGCRNLDLEPHMLTAVAATAQGSAAQVSPAAPTLAAGAGPAQPHAAGLPTLVVTPTCTSTPTPILTPTPPPSIKLERMRLALRDGDYAQAVALGQELLAARASEFTFMARLALAQALVSENRLGEAVSLLLESVGIAETAEQAVGAWGLLASIYQSQGDRRSEIEALQRCLEAEQGAVNDIRWRLAQAHRALEQYDRAQEQLERIDLSALSASRQAEALELLAVVQRNQGDYQAALQSYERILDFAVLANYRMLVRYRQAETLVEAGSTDQAIEVLRNILREQADGDAALLAMQALDRLGVVSVDDLRRGMILYRAGQYSAGISALQRYLSQGGASPAAAQYYLGLCYVAQRDYPKAFAALDVVIEKYPNDARAPEAWIAKARASAAYGGDATGIYHEFVRRYPAHARAPEALWSAAVALERAGEWQRAASYYRRVYIEYPSDSGAAEALFREALCYYAAGEARKALPLWQQGSQASGLAVEEQARRFLWVGLAARKMGDEALALQSWQQAMQLAPASYVGLRARDLSQGKRVQVHEAYPAPSPLVLTANDWNACERWLRSWASPLSEQETRVLQRGLARAEALWRLGWMSELQSALRELRTAAWARSWELYELARLGMQIEQDWLAVTCAERLIAMGRNANAAAAPLPLQWIAYPTNYGHLIDEAIEGSRLDALLFLALIRQESRFDPRAVSSAGARGLTQVMPDTGAWIAQRLATDGYRHEWLFRPMISVRFGVYYLNRTLEERDGDWFAALVAYNAGPGNLTRWSHGQPIEDHDLFVELLPAQQTKDYIRLIYQQYDRYLQIYRATLTPHGALE